MQKHEAQQGSSEMEITMKSQVIGRIEHHRTGEPVRVAFTAAGLSLPAGTKLYAQQSPRAPIDLIKNDAFAVSFQSVRQYREALLQSIQDEIETDTAGLVEALEAGNRAIGMLFPGASKIFGLDIQALNEACIKVSSALAAHRKQGGES